MDETNDVTFTSTSGTGQFLNSSGSAVSTTMSKNTSSRTFYYRDTAVGSYVITVSIKGRTTNIVFSSTQSVLVTTASTTVGGGSDTGTSATSSTASGFLSSHSGQTAITTTTQLLNFQTAAGRDRIALVGVPLKFNALTSVIPSPRTPSYTWSFGDGTMGYGETILHKYYFSGDYNVVLNVAVSDSSAVSRTKVKVVTPDVRILSVKSGQDGYVELANESQYEVNMENWYMTSTNGATFAFAPDTIINANSSVKFPFAVPNDNARSVALFYPDHTEKSHFDIAQMNSESEDNTKNFEKNTDISPLELQARVDAANSRLIAWRREWIATHNVASAAPTATPVHTADSVQTNNTDQTALLINAMRSEQNGGGVWASIKRFFGL